MTGILIILSADAESQDPAFSQFYANPLYMNPAMAGVEGPAKLYLGYRNQWPGATNPYVTYHASFEKFIEPLQGGIGIHMNNDRQGGGVFNTLSLDAIYAYHLQVSSRLMISGGFQASVGQRNMDPSDLVLPSDLLGAGTTTLIPYSKVFPDFAVGFGAFYKNFYGGVAAHHLLEPYSAPSEDPNTRLSRKYTAHLGATYSRIRKATGQRGIAAFSQSGFHSTGYLSTTKLWIGGTLQGAYSGQSGSDRIFCFHMVQQSSLQAMETDNSGFATVMMPNSHHPICIFPPWDRMNYRWWLYLKTLTNRQNTGQ